uniref:Bm5260 n=1 Tax=Brugia malayi TaxID=6279 RepID=A0A1I9GC50_BRUMA|nr:Bm5260 [Brugia malayi]
MPDVCLYTCANNKIWCTGTAQSFCVVYLNTYLSDTQPLWSMLHHIITVSKCVYDQWN